MIPQTAAVDLSRTPQLALMHGKTQVLERSSQIQRRARLRYLFAVPAVVSAVGVDSRPWRDGEQHVSSAVSGLSGAAIEADVSQRKFRRDLSFFSLNIYICILK